MKQLAGDQLKGATQDIIQMNKVWTLKDHKRYTSRLYDAAKLQVATCFRQAHARVKLKSESPFCFLDTRLVDPFGLQQESSVKYGKWNTVLVSQVKLETNAEENTSSYLETDSCNTVRTHQIVCLVHVQLDWAKWVVGGNSELQPSGNKHVRDHQAFLPEKNPTKG